MERYTGKAINGKIAIGKLLYYSKEPMVLKETAENTQNEIDRYEAAVAATQEQLGELYEKALAEVGDDTAAIFEFHQMLLEDDDYTDSVMEYINDCGYSAEFAVKSTCEKFAAMFDAMDDEYMKGRSSDVKDISGRVLANLMGRNAGHDIEEPVIMAVDELTPGDTMQLDRSKLLGIVTDIGSDNSHTAILARAMDIPAVCGVKLSANCNGVMAILDGHSGELIVEPDEETLTAARERYQAEMEKGEQLKRIKDLPAVTKDGRSIKLYANIGSPDDVAMVLENGGEGIGLFRSEFLYLESSDYPTEDEQYEAYKAVAEAMQGREVIIRTLDIGADKQADYFGLDREENPALGYRAIRICLTRQDIFCTQLRAILRSAACGNVSVMFPMISSLWEVRRAKELLEKCRRELQEESIETGGVKVGIMIETPAAALISDMLAEEVDFFSIGTNDLTQYTLAADRQNRNIEEFRDTHHPAVLKLIKMTVDNAHACGIPVGICGELGADESLTDEFLTMGIDELSVAPAKLLPLREKIRNI